MNGIFKIIGIGALVVTAIFINKNRRKKGLVNLTVEETAVRVAMYGATRVPPMLTLAAIWAIPAMVILTLPSENGDLTFFYDYCWLFLIPGAAIVFAIVDMLDMTGSAGSNYYAGMTEFNKSRKHYLRLAMETEAMKRRVGWWPAPVLKLFLGLTGIQFGKPGKA